MILYYLPTARGEAPLKGLSDGSYHAEWFDPRTGEKAVYGDFTPEKGCWTAPARPGDGDWIGDFCLSQIKIKGSASHHQS